MTERLVRSLYGVEVPPSGEFPVDRPERGYNRKVLQPRWDFHKRAAIIEGLVGSDKSVLVVGCGFGFLNEELMARGMDVRGIDPGPWYWETRNNRDWNPKVKALTLPVTALDYSGHFDVVVDEDAITMHDDEEIPAFVDKLHELGDLVVHMVTPLRTRYGDSAVNWKTMDEWIEYDPHMPWYDLNSL